SQISETDFPLLLRVNASAGAGKTSLLAAWFIRLLFDNRVRPGNVLGITFTNAATTEMKKRIFSLLKSVALENKVIEPLAGLIPEQSQEKAQELVNELISGYSDFNIKTIDSFINSLVTLAGLETGISPGCRVYTDTKYYLELNLRQILRSYGRKNEESLTASIDDFLKQSFEISRRGGWKAVEPLLDRLIHLRSEELKIRENLIEPPQSKLAEKKTALDSCIHVFLDCIVKSNPEIFPVNFVKFLETTLESRVPSTNKQWILLPEEWLKKNRTADFQGLDQALISAYSEFLDAFVIRNASCVHSLHTLMRQKMDSSSGTRNILFIDELNKKISSLINQAGDLPWCFFLAGSDLRHFLIDEFQDTSLLQFSNLLLLLKNALSQNPPGGSSLFFVGDVKQAIYRFSGGDADLFLETPDFFPAVEKKLDFSLNMNFRSGGNIVSFVSRTFAPKNIRAWISGFKLEKQKVDRTVTAEAMEKLERLYANSAQDVQPAEAGKGFIRVERYSGENSSADCWIEKRLINIFSELSERFPSGGKSIGVLVRKGSEEAFVTSVLLSMKNLSFPVICDRSSDIREHHLTSGLISFLRFLQNPLDDLSFSAAVCGNLFCACSGIPTSCIFSCLEQRMTGKPAYIAFRDTFPAAWTELISPFFKQTGFLPPYDLISGIISGWNCLKNFPEAELLFHFILELASEQEEEGGNDLESLIVFLDSQKEDHFRPGIASGGDGVRVMTMHKAKGLAFDIVILPGLSMKTINSRSGEFFISLHGGLVLAGMNKKYADLLGGRLEQGPAAKVTESYLLEQTESFVDEFNLIYVAFTRAREEIYAFFPARGGDVLASLFFQGEELLAETGCISVSDRILPTAPATSKFIVSSASSSWHEKLVRDKIDLSCLDARSRARTGELIHAALSRIHLIEPDEIAEAAKAAVFSAASRHDEETRQSIFTLVCSAIKAAPEFFPPEGDTRAFTELGFITPDGDRLVADRVLLSETELKVIDFKTGAVSHEHDSQVRRYAFHLNEIFPGRRISAYIYYLDGLIIKNVETIPSF
ncbi:MAG: UvrD-helicase domain-containing protein, partial [Candidatus Wallbacteria bacterium]|nr:UvrD-helicase domain-containing protein [Candidatus Wallbacteria bacterium]